MPLELSGFIFCGQGVARFCVCLPTLLNQRKSCYQTLCGNSLCVFLLPQAIKPSTSFD